MPAADVVAMYIALVGFTGSVYPDRLEQVRMVEHVMQFEMTSLPILASRQARYQWPWTVCCCGSRVAYTQTG